MLRLGKIVRFVRSSGNGTIRDMNGQKITFSVSSSENNLKKGQYIWFTIMLGDQGIKVVDLRILDLIRSSSLTKISFLDFFGKQNSDL